MCIKMRQLNKLFVAHGTIVGPLPTMCSAVAIKITLGIEGLATEVHLWSFTL